MALAISLQLPGLCHAGGDEAIGISSLYEITQIALDNGTAAGLKIMRTDDQPLAFVIKCPHRFALCGSFNIKAMEKRRVTAVIFKKFCAQDL